MTNLRDLMNDMLMDYYDKIQLEGIEEEEARIGVIEECVYKINKLLIGESYDK